jgi:hypothetical protein
MMMNGKVFSQIEKIIGNINIKNLLRSFTAADSQAITKEELNKGIK